MGASFEDAPCAAFYRCIRAGAPADALQIGQGYNRAPPGMAVLDHLPSVTKDLLTSGRLAEYSYPDDDRERALLADMVNQLLGTSFEDDDVVFTNGATEASAWRSHGPPTPGSQASFRGRATTRSRRRWVPAALFQV
jgi:hypothetical protein